MFINASLFVQQLADEKKIVYAAGVPARVILKNVSWFTGESWLSWDLKSLFGGAEEDLKFHFDRFGKVQHVKLLYDWETGLHRGFAFVVFENIDDAIKAVQQRNHYINGRKISSTILYDVALRYFPKLSNCEDCNT
ncbi:hypothetical protein X798_03243 [Onchocerca flexuosa]|uniref:RRM domain-containing protein n=1 Tax=Onchocerca flexuosa TaxID=387005 RepID=A0A238BYQ1_9BILA|nr:hypothetical protein X798_03243 [Onchocerca flexuosa]